MDRDTINVYDRAAREPVNVPDHPMNKEPEITTEEARREALNDELSNRDLPLVLSSNMSADPCEGVQGSYSAIIDSECDECPSEYGIVNEAHTLAGVGNEVCLLCEAEIRDWR